MGKFHYKDVGYKYYVKFKCKILIV